MAAHRTDQGQAACGLRPISTDEQALLARSCPDLDSGQTVGDASIALLERLRVRDDPDLLLLFCQLNRREVADELRRIADEQALPASIEPLTAEVLAETLDAVRSIASRSIEREYQSIHRRCRRVMIAFTDECRGFVPILNEHEAPELLVEALAERIELPESLLAFARSDISAAAARVVAAQTLLQLSRHDRSMLLEDCAPHHAPETSPQSPSVAHLLSHASAVERYRLEIDHSMAWAQACLRRPALTHGRSQP